MMALAPKFRNWLRTLGAPEDPVATDTSSEWSAMSLLKAIYAGLADGAFVSGVTFAAEGFANQATRAIAITANYTKQAKASKVAAAASAVSTAADVVTTAGNAMIAADAAGLVAGNAMLGQRAKKDRVLAQAAAASIPSAESIILPTQIFS
jgi:hypothetical protein